MFTIQGKPFMEIFICLSTKPFLIQNALILRLREENLSNSLLIRKETKNRAEITFKLWVTKILLPSFCTEMFSRVTILSNSKSNSLNPLMSTYCLLVISKGKISKVRAKSGLRSFIRCQLYFTSGIELIRKNKLQRFLRDFLWQSLLSTHRLTWESPMNLKCRISFAVSALRSALIPWRCT